MDGQTADQILLRMHELSQNSLIDGRIQVLGVRPYE
jgi:hypothetical protein